MIPARTEYGVMVDFLRANTWCSLDQYMWGMSMAQIQLASMDFTRTEYLNKEDKNTIVIGEDDDGDYEQFKMLNKV